MLSNYFFSITRIYQNSLSSPNNPIAWYSNEIDCIITILNIIPWKILLKQQKLHAFHPSKHIINPIKLAANNVTMSNDTILLLKVDFENNINSVYLIWDDIFISIASDFDKLYSKTWLNIKMNIQQKGN